MQAKTTAASGAKILVVDDEAMTRTMLRALLEEAGTTVVEAANGAEAVTRFETERPNLVLLDVMMPGLNGFETCQLLRAIPGAGETVPIMMMTGSNDVATVNRAYEAGATDFEVKTISPAVLWQRIRYLLRAERHADELRESEARLATAERIVRAGSWEWHHQTGTHQWSRGLFRLFGMNSADHQPSHELFLGQFHSEEREPLRVALATAVQAGTGYAGEHRIVRQDGGFWTCRLHADVIGDRGDPILPMTGVVQDVSDLRSAQDQLRALAFFDQCTGLPNRNLLRQQVAHVIEAARRTGTMVAILFLDLDNFKRVNDTLGHSVGDELLAQVAARLKDAVRSNDFCLWNDGSSGPVLARHGGDEFIVCLDGIRHPEDASRVANRILAAMKQPIVASGRELYMTVSIGISVFPHDGDNPEEVLKHADAAMYDAKNSGRNTFRFFDESLSARAFRRLAMEANLKKAIDDQQFSLDYQPIVEVATGRIVAAESLIRWRHPELGLVGPNDFIPLAEETGMIVELGEWVLEESCRQAAGWQAAGHEIGVSVNFSGRQFWHPEIVDHVGRTLKNSRLAPKSLCIEITEGVLIHDTDDALKTLQRLRELGIQIALDDFGTGHSSLQYLRRFPVDLLKLDRVFVQDVDRNPSDSALSASIAAMARSIGIEPLVEGVERAGQRDHLAGQGFRLMQGYLFGQPMGDREFATMLTTGNGRAGAAAVARIERPGLPTEEAAR